MLEIVSKFGGTSNATAEAVAQCNELTSDSLVTVVSAPGKLTTEQVAEFSQYYAGDPALLAHKITEQLIGNNDIPGALGEFRQNGQVSGETIQSITARYAQIVHGLELPLRGTGWLRDIAPRVELVVKQGEDYASMLGEQLQAEIYQALGYRLLEPSRAPSPLLPRDKATWRSWLEQTAQPSERHVLGGNMWFDGQHLRTFDRGGSDISGALAAYGVGASEYHNMTDTPGKSADPRLIDPSRLRSINHLTYQEGRELGMNGTGLLHPEAIVPLVGTGIPTIIRNTFDPHGESTRYSDIVDDPARTGRVMAISLIRDVTVVAVYEPGMNEATGKVASYGSLVADAGINTIGIEGDGVDRELVIVQGDENGVRAEQLLRSAVNGGGEVTSAQLALVTLVGYQIKTKRRYMENHLAEAGVFGEGQEAAHMLPGEHSIRFAVDRDRANQVVSEAHRILIENE